MAQSGTNAGGLIQGTMLSGAKVQSKEDDGFWGWRGGQGRVTEAHFGDRAWAGWGKRRPSNKHQCLSVWGPTWVSELNWAQRRGKETAFSLTVQPVISGPAEI